MGLEFSPTTAQQTQDIKPLQQNGQTTGADKNYAIGERLSTGDVNPEYEAVQVNNTTSTQVQSPTTQNSTENFLGYSIDDLKKYLRPINGSKVDSMSFDELINLAEKSLKAEIEMLKGPGYLTDEENQLLNKIFPEENGIEKAVIEAYFNAATVSKILSDIVRENNVESVSSDKLHSIYQNKSYICNEVCQDSAINETILNLLQQMDAEKDPVKKIDIFIEFVTKMSVCTNVGLSTMTGMEFNISPEDYIYELLNQLLPKTALSLDNKKAILQSLDKLSEKGINLDGLTKLINDCENDEEKIELITSLNFNNLTKVDPEVLEYIIDFVVTKLFKNGDVTATDKQNLDYLEDAANNGGELTPEAKKALLEFLPILTTVSAIRDDVDNDNKLGQAIEDNCTEEEKRRIYEGINNIWNQHPDWFQGIDNDKFQEIMDRISNGNYSIVANDIFRGDGIQTPLNMPEGSSYGEGSSNTGAYDQSSGGFYTQQLDYYAQQSRIFALQQGIYSSSNSDNLPQLQPQTEEQTSDAKPTLLSSFQQWDKYYGDNKIKGIKDVITNKVTVLFSSLKDYVIKLYKLMDKTAQGSILCLTSGNWFGKLLHNTKASAVKSVLACGVKFSSFNNTKRAEEMVQEAQEEQDDQENLRKRELC